jgi:hypothetical protein
MASDAVIKLRPLRIRQACRVRFQALWNMHPRIAAIFESSSRRQLFARPRWRR